MTPAGVASLSNRAEFVAFLTKLFAGLNDGGFSHSTAGRISAVKCNKNLAIMDVSNVKRLKGDGSVLEEIDAHYILTATDDGWKFAAAIVCEPGWRENTE